VESDVARRIWTVLEPYHSVLYYAPETREACDAAGLKGGWMAYFACRAAPMGPVPAEVVIATFYNFHPSLVRRAIPDAWGRATPARVLEARHEAVDRALQRLLGDGVAAPEVEGAAALARQAAEGGDLPGRPIYAANSALPWPDEPHVALWHAATLLREHRGDGHVASLFAGGFDGCEAHVSLVSLGEVPAALVQKNRGWPPDEWSAAVDRLGARGLVDGDGAATAAGRAAREAVERRTDELALVPYRALGDERCERLWRLVHRLARTVVDQGGVPYPNPIGVPPAQATGPVQDTVTPSTRPSV
jgi:hypothetical protein